MRSTVTQRSKMTIISSTVRRCPETLYRLTLGQSHLPFEHAKRRAKSVTFATRQKEMTGALATFFFFYKKSGKKGAFFLAQVHAGPLQASGESLPQQEDMQAGMCRRAAAAWTFLRPPLATLACRRSHRSRPACSQPGEVETCKTAAAPYPLAAFSRALCISRVQ